MKKIAKKIFKDKELLSIAKSAGTGKCLITGKTGLVFDENSFSNLAENFQRIIDLYSDFPKTKKKIKQQSGKLFEKLYDDWDFFDKNFITKDQVLLLLETIFENKRNKSFFRKKVFIEEDTLQKRKKYLIISNNDWLKFSKHLKNENRYFNDIFNSFIFDYFIDAIKNKIYRNDFYRARISSTREPFSEKEMRMPPCKFATSGRASPAFIPIFYIGNNEKALVKECRSSCKDYISIATFSLKKDCLVYDLRLLDSLSPFFIGDPLYLYFNRKIIKTICAQISRPMRTNDDISEYIPVQFLCQYLKYKATKETEEIIGVAYSSVVSNNKDIFNIAAFSDEYFDFKDVVCYQISDFEPSLTKIS